jgi:phage I-like protein
MIVTEQLFMRLPTSPSGVVFAPPEWIHLVPAGKLRVRDGRGPWELADPNAVVLASQANLPLLIDEVHATDLAAPAGHSAPARGWVEQLQVREDGIWGRVEWTPSGVTLLSERAYRGISPALRLDAKSGRVLAVLRASLTNTPNLLDLVTLNQQDHDNMDLIEQLRALHGLPAEADAAAVVQACRSAQEAASGAATALNSIAAAAGLPAGQDATALASAIAASRQAAGDTGRMAAELVSLQSQLTTLRNEGARERAIAAVDGAIRAGKVIPGSLREHYITRHMGDAKSVETELAAMPALNSGGIIKPPPEGGAAEPDGDEAKIIALLGIDPKSYVAARQRFGESVENA